MCCPSRYGALLAVNTYTIMGALDEVRVQNVLMCRSAGNVSSRSA